MNDASANGSLVGAFAVGDFENAAKDYFYVFGTSGTITLSGFSASDTVYIKLAACINVSSWQGDYKVDGAFAGSDPNGNDFNLYTNGYQNGSVLEWKLGGLFSAPSTTPCCREV